MAQSQRHQFTLNGTSLLNVAFDPKEVEPCPTCHHVPAERDGEMRLSREDGDEHVITGAIAVALNDLIVDLAARAGMRYYP